MLYTSESIRPLTSIVSYPERGEGGNNKYRGNCSPKLIEDLIGFFKPSEICDYMCGSGTTGAAAAKCGISSKLYDLLSGSSKETSLFRFAVLRRCIRISFSMHREA